MMSLNGDPSIMSSKISIGILGATGVVGQRFIQMLEHHPWFEVAWLAASDRSEGKTYAEAVRWRLRSAIPANVAKMKVSPAAPEGAPKVIFAALDASIAAEMEPRFAEAGCAVVSNSSALRMQSDVPLVIPEVNPEHIHLVDGQGWRKKSGGYVVTNPNCSAIGLVLALAPLQARFGLDAVMAVTMQAVSGAGYPGVASLDILGNVRQAEGQLEQAFACYERALELQPDLAMAHVNMGHLREAQGNLREAAACYERALELKPGYAEAESFLQTLDEQAILKQPPDSCFQH